MTKEEHMAKMLKRHDAKMRALEKQIANATGFRKQDLIRHYNQMAKDRDEFVTYCLEAQHGGQE